MTHLVITGTVVGGFTYYGPFVEEEDAVNFGEHSDEDFEVAELETPESEGYRVHIAETVPAAAGVLSIIVIGGPLDGFTFWGPFNDPDAAAQWALREQLERDWWSARLFDEDEDELPILER